MSKPILVQTHERSGTHLTINLINYQEFGKFATIGYIPKESGRTYSLKQYIDAVYKHIHVYAHIPDEAYIGKRISDNIPDLHDERFPNFAPNRGMVGGHRIDKKTQKNILEYL